MGTTNTYIKFGEDVGKAGTNVSGGRQGSSMSFLAGLASTFTGKVGRGIEVLEFDLEIEQKGSQVGGKPRSVESVEPGEFKIVKAVDGASPLLFRWCCSGEYLGTVDVECYSVDPDTPYAAFRMKGVHIAKYNPSSDGGLPTEAISLKYGRLTVEYNFDGLGSSNEYGNGLTGKVDKAWSWVLELPV